MTILIILALLALGVIYAVFFLLCKVAWLIFKSHSNKGPLITAGVCTVLLSVLIGAGIWLGTRAVLAPFQGIKARIAQNPAPVYGEHTYQDEHFPFELTVYDGMDFADWINLGGVQVKLGIDTNAFKKDAAGKRPENFLMAVLVRQSAIDDKAPLEVLENQLEMAQAQRRLTLSSAQYTTVNGLPAYQAQGEAYSNRGKVNFWVTSVQTAPDTLYYVGALALNDTPDIQTQALGMENSFRLTSN